MPRSGPNPKPNLRNEAVTSRQWLGESFTQNCTPSGIIVGRDLVHRSRTISRFEVFDVAIASRSSFYRHDLTVDRLGLRIGDPVRTVGHHGIDALLQTPR